LSDEALDLVAAGLRNGATLYLEQGSKPPSDSAVVTVVLVTGNSVDVKYGPTDAGVRDKEVEITVSLQDPVESLRDQAGVLLLGYSPGWTQRCEVLTRGTGARNHLGEDVEIADPVTTADVGQEPAAAAAPVTSEQAPAEDPVPDTAGGGAAEIKQAAVDEFGTEFHGRRLRRTSWLKEPTELVTEVIEETVQQKPAKVTPKANAPRKGVPPAPQPTPSPATAVTIGPLTFTKAVTVKEAGIKSGDTLLLEEGTLPIEGQLNLTVSIVLVVICFIISRFNAVHVSALSCSCGVRLYRLSWRVHIRSRTRWLGRPHSAVPAWSHSALLLLRSVIRWISCNAERLLSCRRRLSTLRRKASQAKVRLRNDWWLALCQHSRQLSCCAGIQSSERLLLRELKPDMLPGRSYWTTECNAPDVVSSATTAQSTASRTVTKTGNAINPVPPTSTPKASAKLATTPAVSTVKPPQPPAAPLPTLKKLNIQSEKGLVVEVLPDVQGAVRPPPGAMKLWVQLLANPGAAEGKAVVQPLWPPLPALLNGGSAPTLGHLKRALTAVYPDLPTEHLSVYKYQSQAIEWTGLIAGGVGLHVKRRGGGAGKKAVESNVA
jgi:hypothetical protein